MYSVYSKNKTINIIDIVTGNDDWIIKGFYYEIVAHSHELLMLESNSMNEDFELSNIKFSLSLGAPNKIQFYYKIPKLSKNKSYESVGLITYIHKDVDVISTVETTKKVFFFFNKKIKQNTSHIQSVISKVIVDFDHDLLPVEFIDNVFKNENTLEIISNEFKRANAFVKFYNFERHVSDNNHRFHVVFKNKQYGHS